MIDKTFIKKTRKGAILKIVREHYLRDDLSCSSELCLNSVCLQSFKTAKCLLDKSPKSLSLKFDKPHYIVPDTNIILHQVRDLI
jgi:exosome complex exonuclease DIS3/RRP44